MISGVAVYWAYQGRWGWNEDGQLCDLSVLDRLSSFLPKMSKGGVRNSRAYMILSGLHGL